jgi:hypothetical protein
MFIKLTEKYCDFVYININHITAIRPSEKFSFIELVTNDNETGFYTVEESPEEIIYMIEEMKK